MLAAVYFDGRSTRPRPVRIAIQSNYLVVAEEGASVPLRRLLNRVVIQPPPRHSPQRIDLGEGAALEIDDKAALADMLQAAGIRPGVVERAERSWLLVLGALLVLVLVNWMGYRWILPWASMTVSRWVPQHIEQKIGDQVWPFVDQHMFSASKLTPARREQLTASFARSLSTGAPVPAYRLEFRESADHTPNAFALPGGIIVITDELVGRAHDDDALIGVLAHELGHVAHRHTLRNLLQGTAISAVVGLWLGDTSALLASMTTTLATLKYSRDFETEADDYALARLQKAGLSGGPMADLLQELDQNPGAGDRGWWSSHPLTAERVSRLRAQPREGTP